MASPPRSVLLLKQQFEGGKKAKVPVRRNRSSNDLYVNVASTTSNNQQQIPAAGSTSRKCTGVNLPKDGSGRAFMLVSSPPAGRVQKPKFLPSGSSHNKDEVSRLSTTSNTRKTSGNAADKSGSSNLLKKPKLPAKPQNMEFRMKHRSMSLGNFYTKPSVKSDDDNSTAKDSDLSLQESSQQVEADETRPVCVSERAKRFGGEDRRRKPHQPPETRTPDTGIKFGGISSDKWGRSLSTDNEDNNEQDKRETSRFKSDQLHQQESKKMGAAFGKSRAKEGTGFKQTDGKLQMRDGSTSSGHPNLFARWFSRNRVKSAGQSVSLPQQSQVEEDDKNLAEGSRLKELVQDPVVLPHFQMQNPNRDQKLAQEVPLSNAEKPGSHPIDDVKKSAMPLPENRSLLVRKARPVTKKLLAPPTEDILVQDKPLMSEQSDKSDLLTDILCVYDASKESKDHPEEFSKEKHHQQDSGSLLTGDDCQEATQPKMPSLPRPFKVAKKTKPDEPSQDVSSHHTSVQVEAQVHYDENSQSAPSRLPSDVRKELLGAVSKRNSTCKQSPRVPLRVRAKPVPPPRSSTSLLSEDHKNNVHISPCSSPIAIHQGIKYQTVLAEQTKPSVDSKQGAKKLVRIMQDSDKETKSVSEQSQEKTAPASHAGTPKPLPVIPSIPSLSSQADCSPPPTPKMGNVLKPSPLTRKKKRSVDLPENESVPKTLPKAPQGVKPPLPEKPMPSLLKKQGKKPSIVKTPSLDTPEKEKGIEACDESQVKDHDGNSPYTDNPGDDSEITPEQGSADTSFISGADIGNGSSATLEGSVIPLSQNPLMLVQDETPMPEIQRRRSSLHDDILGTTSISNARGLFQKALKVSSSEPLQTTEKPPVPTKPKILPKPLAAVNNSATTPIVKNGQPNVSPKVACPKRHNAARFNPAKQNTPMESNNIYDDVYQEAPSPPDTAIPKLNRSSKKLEQFFGQEVPEAGDDNSATTNVGKSKKRLSDKDGPYAIIPIPDVDKTAAKKSNITNGNGQAVLRNSGGMSSGDSGVLMHSDLMGQERKQKTRDRRMSRRILRRQMRSMDSDFAEDSDDDEPIGTASDFDSDASEDMLEDVIPEPVQFLDETHKKAYEVLTTERTYVKNLYLIDQIFFARITQENQKHSWFPPTVPMEIFSNISTIYRLHSDVILCALEKQLKEWETNPCLGEVLKDNAHFLKLYSFYVGNFNHAMKQLNSWTSKVPKFAAAISELQRRPECGGLALQHHMLTPVQRIPRYELLLKEYLRKLPEDARDRPSAEKALGIISGAAKHSNDMMKSMEQFEKLLKINEKIEGEDIIDPTRHLLKEGKIIKIANKSKDPQDRYIYLFNDILLCCEKKRLLTASASYKVKLKLEVDGMKVLDSDNCRFIIEGKTKSIELQTNTEEDREDWMAALLSAIREMVRKKESFKTNDAVGDRSIIEDDDDEDGKFVPGKCEPRWIKDDETTMCMRCGTDFKLIKRRHHCRACGAVVCNKCSSFESPLQYDNSKMNKVCCKCYYTLKGDVEELKKMERRSLITELADEASFGSFLYLQKGGWVKYWVVVTDQDLYALKAPKDVRAVLTIPIKLYTVSDVDSGSSDKDNVFRLTNGTDRRMMYTFAAESREMKKRWITVLTNGLEELSSKSQTI
ncbi:uncharacterized protein LOC117307082 isoform X2 [Asterias rubens]|uniref:uncharacterized protein LOC117307082 isoform X2 n=1 Tax=Asterias rubens TaxID=7604 RepID=UPI00145594A0|nr:uncharacterized protein LOC117307082 isoform X2 [Asterias rubens]